MIPTGGVLTAAPAPQGPAATTVRALRGTTPDPAATLLPGLTGGDEPPLTIPRDPAQEAARRELSKQLYHQDDPSLFERALDTFWNWVDDLLGAASTATPGGALGLVVIVLAVVAVLAALWWRLGTPRRQPVSTTALFDHRPRSAAQHRAAAEAHAAQSHWNQAVQESMRAIVRSLEERALLDTRPGRTADEAAAEASRALPAHADRLAAAARNFDDVTYGGRSATEQSYRRIAALDHDLERTRPQLTPSNAHNAAHHTSGGAAP
ncbi:DUF4129 domain-containing protein [Streptomyces sp. NPDC018693]|uniref:DUF4129 domain-containing protein n=1 Tax=unclassified Streptomyces TaxID=2593676 RepID=UPI0037ADFF18